MSKHKTEVPQANHGKSGDLVPHNLTTHEEKVKKPIPNVSVHDDQTAADTTLQGISIETKNTKH